MNVAFVTGSRSDWRLVAPLVACAGSDARLTPHLLVTGSHLSARHGETVRAIRAAGLETAACVPILEETDSAPAVARATGRAVIGISAALEQIQPAWTVVVGDRYESFAAGVAATMLGIPLAHVAGGETDIATNQDCNLRNALTKLAQIHFVSHDLAAARVHALGEEAWRVHVVGLPSLDGIADEAADFTRLQKEAPLPLECGPRSVAAGRRFVLVSFLPVTLEADVAREHLDTLMAALERLDDVHKLFVLSNADTGGDAIDNRIRAWAAHRNDVTLVAALAPELYLAALRDAACYVGNSSSGVIESPTFGTPALIIGTRQSGRPCAANTMTVAAPTISAAYAVLRGQIEHGTYRDVVSPYGDGEASSRICTLLATRRQDALLMTKRVCFADAAEADAVSPAALLGALQ